METNERLLAAVSDVEFSDSELVAAIRDRNHDALATLYERYWSLVFRASNRMLGDASAAEDVVQSVFLSLWSTPPAVTENGAAAWLVMVARNRTRDALRARAAQREAVYPVHLVDTGNLDEIVHQRLQHARVRAALAALPASQRTLIELGFYGERTHVELAELMQLPLGTIKTRIRSGLRQLRWSFASAEGSRPGGTSASPNRKPRDEPLAFRGSRRCCSRGSCGGPRAVCAEVCPHRCLPG